MGYWKLMGVYDAETTTYSALAGTNGTSPFTPTQDGVLKAIRVVESSQAVTSVITHAQFKFTCDTFKPNSLEFGFVGSGLHTAPRAQPNDMLWTFGNGQQVKAGTPITMEGRVSSAYTNVTVEIAIYGYFE